MSYLDSKSADVRDRLIAENKHAFAIPSNMPIVPGHVLVFPKRVVVAVYELNDNEMTAIFELLSRLRAALKTEFNAEGFNYAWNEGKVAGQSLDHLHIHMLPRKKGDKGISEYEPRQFLYRPGSRAESSAEELSHIAKNLRDRLDAIAFK